MNKKTLYWIVWFTCVMLVSIENVTFIPDDKTEVTFRIKESLWTFNTIVKSIFIVIGIDFVSEWASKKFYK